MIRPIVMTVTAIVALLYAVPGRAVAQTEPVQHPTTHAVPAAEPGDLLVELGFREREIARREELFGNIAHVFSTYEGVREGDPEPFVRGINSIQLLNDGSRWWIVSVYWQAEGPVNPLPARYLPGDSDPASS